MANFPESIFPPPDEALQLEPEELAVFLLRHMALVEKSG